MQRRSRDFGRFLRGGTLSIVIEETGGGGDEKERKNVQEEKSSVRSSNRGERSVRLRVTVTLGPEIRIPKEEPMNQRLRVLRGNRTLVESWFWNDVRNEVDDFTRDTCGHTTLPVLFSLFHCVQTGSFQPPDQKFRIVFP